MKQLSAFVVLAVASVGLMLMPARQHPVTPLPPDDTAVESAVVDAAQSVARCPWARGDGFIDGAVAVAALAPTDASFSVSSSGSIVGDASVGLEAFGSVDFLDLANIGTGSVFVEFGAGPAAAVAVGEGASAVASAGCRSGASKVWLLAGASTLDGETLQLRLFNPFPQDARVRIRAVSENDVEPETSLESITVAAMSTATFELSELLSLREVLALSISDEEGLVAPAFVQALEVEDEDGNERDADIAAWTGVTASRRWEFPYTRSGELNTTLTLFNDQAVAVSWSMDVVGRDGRTAAAGGGTLEAVTVAQIQLAELVDEPAGIVITAEEPIGAFLTGSGPTQRAGTAGLRSSATRWLVPGISAMGGPVRVWVMNAGATDTTITYTASIDGRLGQPEKLSVPGGTVRSFSASQDLLIESGEPVTVGWIRSTGETAAFTVATPVSDG